MCVLCGLSFHQETHSAAVLRTNPALEVLSLLLGGEFKWSLNKIHLMLEPRVSLWGGAINSGDEWEFNA